nr:MAG TPA: hypothetical protein [Caudoviricetes sp.]
MPASSVTVLPNKFLYIALYPALTPSLIVDHVPLTKGFTGVAN